MIDYGRSVALSCLPFLKKTIPWKDNGNYSWKDFSQVEYYPFSVKAFADQRRKVKPARKHVASRNPVKVLKTRDGVTDGLEPGDEDVEEGDAEKVNKFFDTQETPIEIF